MTIRSGEKDASRSSVARISWPPSPVRGRSAGVRLGAAPPPPVSPISAPPEGAAGAAAGAVGRDRTIAVYRILERPEPVDYLVVENFIMNKKEQPAWDNDTSWQDEFEPD